MTEIITILSKEMCEKHAKHPKCKMAGGELEITACCAPFNHQLMDKLKTLNKQSSAHTS